MTVEQIRTEAGYLAGADGKGGVMPDASEMRRLSRLMVGLCGIVQEMQHCGRRGQRIPGKRTQTGMKLTIKIEMDNAAFFDDEGNPRRNAEVGRILHLLAQKIENAWELEAGQGFALMDSNGNRVGLTID